MQHRAPRHVTSRPAHRRRAALLLSAVAVALVFFAQVPSAGATPSAPLAVAADAGTEAAFVAALNSVRAQHGVAPLAVYDGLVGVARGWSDHMAAAGGISHNPDLAGSVAAPWHKLGENVGVGYDVNGLMAAFVKSPAHYENIVDPEFNYVGVGVSYGADGRLYTTHDFMGLDTSNPNPPPATAPAPVAANHTSHPAPAPEPAPPAPPAPPPPPPPPPADPALVHAVLTALRAVSD